MRKSILVVAAVIFFTAAFTTVVFATGEEGESWSRTTMSGATAKFTMEHGSNLTTTGSVEIARTLRGGSFIGVEIVEEVMLQASLKLCAGDADCHKVWVVGAHKSFYDFPSPLDITGSEASVSVEFP